MGVKADQYNPRIQLKIATDQTKSYRDSLETATTGNEIFKYLMLMDTASIEAYTAQTRIQAEQSFTICKYVAGLGFGLIFFGSIIGIWSHFAGNILDTAYLTAIAGILSEFISGIFFVLYNKTIEQVNRFHDKMMTSKKEIISLLAQDVIGDATKKDDTMAELSKTLMSKQAKE